jgi:ArsR family metal-binding transcriptional regulator
MKPTDAKQPGYRYQLVNIECLPGSANFNVIMELDESIQELLPYLASALKRCTYKHGAEVINCMDRGHIVAIYPDRLTITDVGNPVEADSLCREYFQKIAEVRSNRASLEPTFEKRSTLTILDILRALPKTNCGECGASTCTEFAAKVHREEEAISRCPPLLADSHKHQELLHKLQSNGYQI